MPPPVRKTILLPLTAHATLNTKLLQAAASSAAVSSSASVVFRIARALNVPTAEQLVVARLRQTHPRLFADPTDVVVDFAKPSELHEALDGCDGLVVSTALSDPDAIEYEMNLVEAAKLVGSVHDVLKVSCAQGLLGEKSGVAIGAQHWELEQRVAQLQFEGSVQFVRPNTLMDTFLQGKLYDMICGRSLSVSVKNGRVAFVHPKDVAELLHVVLTTPSTSERSTPETYAVSGPEALSFQEVAEQLSKGIGHKVTYSYFPLWAVQPSMWIRGERPEAIANEIQLARALEAGAEQDVLSTVEDVLAKPPRSLRQFITEHEDAWPLRAYK